MLTLVGQGLLAFMAGPGRGSNPIYRLFNVITLPVINTIRRLTCGRIADRFVPPLTFVLLFCSWIALAYTKRML